MKVQDFKSFITACQNVCLIKKKKVSATKPKLAETIVVNKEEAKKESGGRASRAQRRRDTKKKLEEEKQGANEAVKKEEEQQIIKLPEMREEYFIMLSPKSMKDMINQFE